MSAPEQPGHRDVDPQPALLRVLVDKLPAMLAYWDANQRCRFANRAYEQWFGADPQTMIGREMKEFLGPLYVLNRPHIEGVLRGEEQEFERLIPDPAGGPPRNSHALYIPDVVDGVVRGFCVLVTDISRLKKAEEALHQMERQLQVTERASAMATLAGGIAHEINNPLAAVLANVEVALERLESAHSDPASLRSSLVEAREGTKRIRAIVQGMKLLARGDTVKREIVDVVDTFEQSIGLASNAVRYRARLVRDFRGPAHIDGNRSQLTQVFVNLLINAAQSLRDDTVEKNEIRVSVGREEGLVIIEVGDNGCGIPEALHARIFEPFFTTKGVGAGTGLGLSITSAIVSALGGSISVRSDVGHGSVFRIALPAAAAPVVVATPAPALRNDGARSARPAAVRPRVLVIDDEIALAKSLRLVLAADCEVVVLNDGRSALALLTGDTQPRFDVILCDLMMPEVSGEDVFTQASRQRPELAGRFVFMTGGAFTARGRAFLDGVQVPVLEKPFDVARLRDLVSAASERASDDR